MARLFLIYVWLITINAFKVHAQDGVQITVVSPAPESTLVSPIAVSISVELTNGIGAETIRQNPSHWHICYSLDYDRPPLNIPILKDSSLSENTWQDIPLLSDDLRLKAGTTHIFETWLCKLDNTSIYHYGYNKHKFYIKQKLSAHNIRLEKWKSDVNSLINDPNSASPMYVEIGTSFFDTLAEQHASKEDKDFDDGWLGE